MWVDCCNPTTYRIPPINIFIQERRKECIMRLCMYLRYDDERTSERRNIEETIVLVELKKEKERERIEYRV